MRALRYRHVNGRACPNRHSTSQGGTRQRKPGNGLGTLTRSKSDVLAVGHLMLEHKGNENCTGRRRNSVVTPRDVSDGLQILRVDSERISQEAGSQVSNSKRTV